MQFFKSGIRNFLRNIGDYEIVSTKTFGNNISSDIKTILKNKTHPVVFDIGANKGDASIEFSELFKDAQIYAFEPDPATYSGLNERLIKQNSGVKTYNFGFGDKVESRELTINKVSGGNSFLEISPTINSWADGGWTEPVGKVEAEIKTLNAFCEENSIEAIDLIKIDTQGYEMKIINGADEILISAKTRLIYIEVLFVELYKQQCYFNEVYNKLNERGFKLVGFYNRFYKTTPPHNLMWCDALFVSEAI